MLWPTSGWGWGSRVVLGYLRIHSYMFGWHCQLRLETEAWLAALLFYFVVFIRNVLLICKTKSVGMGHIQEILLERAVHSWLLMKGCWRTVTVLGMRLPLDYFGFLGFCCVISTWLGILDTSRTDLQGIVLTTDSLSRGLYTHNVRDTHGPISALPFHLKTSFPFFRCPQIHSPPPSFPF